MKKYLILCFFVCCGANTLDLNKVSNIFNEQIVEGVFSRQGRGLKWSNLNQIWVCGADVKCWIEKGEAILDQKRSTLLAQADAEFWSRNLNSGRKTDDKDETPSAVATTVQKLINEISEAIRSGLTSFFRDYKENDSDEKTENGIQDDDDEEEEDEDEARGINGESRKKKKKKKLKAIIKLLVLGAVLKAKLTVLLQLLSAALQVKFFLIALAGLILNIARLWLDIKKGHHPQKVIYYEHAQHQHHYDHLDDEHGGGGWWGRAYEEEEKTEKDYRREGELPSSYYPSSKDSLYAQEMAYNRQKPKPWAP